MICRVKPYGELTRDELYAILRLRVAVFVVEQNCPYGWKIRTASRPICA